MLANGRCERTRTGDNMQAGSTQMPESNEEQDAEGRRGSKFKGDMNKQNSRNQQ